MSLLEDWRNYAYAEELQNSPEGKKLWEKYFELEKGIYEKLLEKPDEVVSGTLKELADRYEVPLSMMVGFLDGINESLKEPNPIDTMEEDTPIKLDIDPEKLYYNMVACGAEWLYKLPQWDRIFTKERQKEIYRQQKDSRTVRNDTPKVGRNEPCPCGSGKKYKHCCGRN